MIADHVTSPKHKLTKVSVSPRARIIGILEFMCPFCGRIQKPHLSALCWRVQCKDAHCKRIFVIGIRLLTPKPGKNIIPIDHYIPVGAPWNEVFAVADTGRWSSGKAANSLEYFDPDRE